MKWISLFFVVFCFAACNPSKKIGKTVRKKEAKTIAEVYATYDAQKIQYKNLEAKVKVKYKDGDKSLPFRATIRIDKEKKVWISAGMFGFEAVRVLATPDSIQVINRLKKEYYKVPISEVQKIAGLPVDFIMLERLLTGDVLVRSKNEVAYKKVQDGVQISSTLDYVKLVALFGQENYQLQSQQLIDTLSNQEMEVFYSDYKNVENDFSFPFKNNVEVKGDDILIDIEFLSMELDTNPSFDFKINKRYEQKEF